MPFFTEAQLRNYSTTIYFAEAANRNLKAASAGAATTIFLSHSHKDKDLAKGLKNFLGNSALISISIGRIPICLNRQTERLPLPSNEELTQLNIF